jgi:NAD(P)-dependent dehydrogenase (short-subunit alcohol dehydrogenase family)
MNRFALITGASTGIGKAVVKRFLDAGYVVGGSARRIERIDNEAIVLECDLSGIESINNLIKKIREITKSVDVIVNVAGIWHGKDEVYAGKDLEDFDQKVILDTFMVGTIAPTLLVHGLVDIMPPGSSVINISGTFENGAKGWLPYFVSKKGIEALTIGLSQELEGKGIKVNCISPSDVATEEYQKYFPEDAQSALNPRDVAQAVFDMANSEKSGEILILKK